MSKKKVAQVAAVLGLATALLCAVADPIGLGSHPGFGTHQFIGVILGVVIFLLGLRLTRRFGRAA